MTRFLAVIILLLLASVFVLAQTGKAKKNNKEKKKEEPLTFNFVEPWENPNRLLVDIFADGGYALNGKKAPNLQALRSQLKEILSKRPLDYRGVCFQASPETKYGELVAVFDMISDAGGMPIMTIVTKADELLKWELVYLPAYFGPQINLPIVTNAYGDVGFYGKNAIRVSISESGVYLAGDVKISATEKNFEQKLTDWMRAAMQKMVPMDARALYIKCDKDAFYADLRPLMRAWNDAGGQQILLVTKKN